MSIELGITIAGFLFVLFGYGIKYGADQQKLASENKRQDDTIASQERYLTLRLDNLDKAASEEKAHNAKQHEEFYQTAKKIDRIETQMDSVLASLAEIKEMVKSRRRASDD